MSASAERGKRNRSEQAMNALQGCGRQAERPPVLPEMVSEAAGTQQLQRAQTKQACRRERLCVCDRPPSSSPRELDAQPRVRSCCGGACRARARLAYFDSFLHAELSMSTEKPQKEVKINIALGSAWCKSHPVQLLQRQSDEDAHCVSAFHRHKAQNKVTL